MRALNVLAGLVLAVALVGCSSDDGGDQPTAEEVADRISASVDVETVVITEDNDPNNLIGRPNGYVGAVILKDPRVEACDELGVDCGATIEEWSDSDAAEDRSEYIKALQEDSPMLGTEYHYLEGPVLVRVSGALKPSEAEEYESALD